MCLSSARLVVADDRWQTETLIEGIRRPPSVSSSNRMGVGPDGSIHVICVDGREKQDRLLHWHGVPGNWQRSLIQAMPHAANSASGIHSYALAMAPDGRPHVYWFAANHSVANIIFSEYWAWHSVATGRWQVRTVREDVGTGGGASIDSPHLAVDSKKRFHMTAYVHNAYGFVHRARHRTVSDGQFPIVPLPNPSGKTDSGESNLFVDGQDRVHFVYGSTRALGGGAPEAGYPDASLAYAVWKDGVWSPAYVVVHHLDADVARRSKVNVISVGLFVDVNEDVHIVLASGYRFPNQVLRVDYLRGRPGRWESWPVTTVETGEDPAPSLQVTNLYQTLDGTLHFGLTTKESTQLFSGRNGTWQSSEHEGWLTGMQVRNRTSVVFSTQTESKLLFHSARP